MHILHHNSPESGELIIILAIFSAIGEIITRRPTDGASSLSSHMPHLDQQSKVTDGSYLNPYPHLKRRILKCHINHEHFGEYFADKDSTNKTNIDRGIINNTFVDMF